MLPLALPIELPFSLPADSPVTWVLVGAAAAVVALVTFRRARRLALVTTMAVVIGIVAWNSGMLPPSS